MTVLWISAFRLRQDRSHGALGFLTRSAAPFRCFELDAAFFHLYGVSRDDADYILDTFPIVKRKDEARFDEYRTKRVILEIYDEMERAKQTEVPYQTRLDPPPGELRAAHKQSETKPTTKDSSLSTE